MEKKAFERYGLTGNPFRDLASETLENVDIFHVDQSIDEYLNTTWEDVSSLENKAFIAIVSGLGSGKTERLLMAANYAEQKGYFCVFRSITSETKWIVKGILENIKAQGDLDMNWFRRVLWPPKWYRDVVKAIKKVETGYDPENMGTIITNALAENAPAFLLLNDLQNLPMTKDVAPFMQTLYIIVNKLEPGTCVMISSDMKYFSILMKGQPSLNQRVNRRLTVPPLTDKEAGLMIAKRMLVKRLVDDLDPIYPFTKDAISVLNEQARGVPRQILQLADVTINEAANIKAINIDADLVCDILKIPKRRKKVLDEKQMKVNAYEVYKHAVYTALRDGIVSPDEEDVLKDVAVGLGLTPEERKIIMNEAKKKNKDEKDSQKKAAPADKKIPAQTAPAQSYDLPEDVESVGKAKSANVCPTCKGQLRWIDSLKKNYCPNCKVYMP